MTQHIGSSDTIFRYNGRDGVVTDENGLIYMRARYYSPAMRRFINADIIPGELSNAITLNRYAYANGNPVSNVDPFGLAAERGSSNKSLKDLLEDQRKKEVAKQIEEMWLNKYKFEVLNSGSDDIVIYAYTYYTGVGKMKKEKIGFVYFYKNVDKDFFDSDNFQYPKNFNFKTDLLIADFTNQQNPNLYAYQAQNVDSKNRDEIIKVMQEYDRNNNTSWNRTDESLMIEWEAHHLFASFDKSAQDIDFDNNEESFSWYDYIKKAAKRGIEKFL